MIPTQFRSKLPRHLSYPIGAEALTEGLAGGSHAELFRVSFFDRSDLKHSEFQRIITQNRRYAILVAQYQPARNPGYTGAEFMIESGWYATKWEFEVYPVLCDLRHVVNRLLRERGLPLVIQWLGTSGQAGWLSWKQRIELVFNPLDETLSPQVSSGA